MDPTCVYTPNFLFASTEEGISQYQADETSGIINGSNDKISTDAGTNNPNFTNFTIQDNVDIMVGISGSDNIPQEYNSTWNFTLQSGSPALTGGTNSITPHFTVDGLVIDNITYYSPAPRTFFGAFGTN